MGIKRIAICSVIGLLLTTTGCDINSSATKKQHQEADSLINVAYETKDYDRIALLADSLKETGGLSEGKAYYWLGYASDRTHKKRMAELYWTKQQLVETLSAEVEAHRNGAEPSDDLTMMCLYIAQ